MEDNIDKRKTIKKNENLNKKPLALKNKKKDNSYNDKKKINLYNDYEINTFDYKLALKYDKRGYFQYYLSILKLKHIILFSFVSNNDYNSMVIKISLFFFSFALYYTINAIFYTEKTIDNIFNDKGRYNFIYQLPK